jgi:hypothetical protein
MVGVWFVYGTPGTWPDLACESISVCGRGAWSVSIRCMEVGVLMMGVAIPVWIHQEWAWPDLISCESGCGTLGCGQTET